MTQTVSVDVADGKTYDISIAQGLLARAGDILAPILPSKKICVVTDENVAKIYLIPLMKVLEAAGFTAYPPIILPAGESVKNFTQLQYIIDRALSYKMDRKSALVALGGGVVGDITGFAASILMRGVPFVQIPTTLLAQVDSAVGGKTAINTQSGKNLVGTFYQPRHVLIDTDTLATLPERERKAGYAEIVKYGLINDVAFFEWLEQNGQDVLAGDAVRLGQAIALSCKAKAAVVSADEKEQKGVRDLLNLGHTFGHALEALGGYDGRLLHGEAVAIGMDMAFRFSVQQGLCPPDVAARVSAHFTKMNLMQKPPFPVTAAEVLEKMRGDKKNTDEELTLILANDIGKVFVSRDVKAATMLTFLEGEWR